MPRTFSIFSEKTRVTLKGDEEGCKHFLGEANKLL